MSKQAILVNGKELDYTGLPEHLRGSMCRYIENRIEPGGFLTAVLSNDLRESCERADDINRYRLFDIVSWLYNFAPAGCWGSKGKVQDWLGG